MVVIFLLSCLAVFLLVESSWWDRLMSYYDLFTDRVWVRDMVKSAGWASALVFLGLQVGQVLFAPIPGEVTGFLGGYMFGVLNGFLLSTVGLTVGSMLAFGIGHFLGERVVRKLVRCESFEKYNQMVQYKGILVIFIFFLVPGFPKDYLCMFLGLTTLPGRVFFVISTVGADARDAGAEPAGGLDLREGLHVLRHRDGAHARVRAHRLAVARSALPLDGPAEEEEHVRPGAVSVRATLLLPGTLCYDADCDDRG